MKPESSPNRRADAPPSWRSVLTASAVGITVFLAMYAALAEVLVVGGTQ